MKGKNILLTAVAILAFVDCSNEENVVLSVKENDKTFFATTESYNPQTKTSLDLDGNVLWKTGDQVSIFAASTINEQYQVSDDSDGKTSASLNKVGSSGFVVGTDLQANFAYYPYSASNVIAKSGSAYTITVNLPSIQNYAENSFGNGTFPMAAITEDEYDKNLKFKNVLGGLKLQLKGTDLIKRITVTGNNDEILCGAAKVTVGNGIFPVLSLSNTTSKMVTLDCGNGVQLDSESPTIFVIALPPMTMTDGFTIDIYNTNGEVQEIKTTKSQMITRSALLVMPAITVACEPVLSCESLPLTFEAIKAGAQIRFIQASWVDFGTNVEYSTDGISWSTYTSGITITLGNVGDKVMFRGSLSCYSPDFGANSENEKNASRFTTTADCYVYGNVMSLINPLDFASVTTINAERAFSGLFYGNTHIKNHVNKSIALPATTLTPCCYNMMFYGCTGITSAPQLPATTLSDHCYNEMFYRCTSLTTAPELPATTLAEFCYKEMFSGCTSLTAAPELPATTLSDYCYSYMFDGCSSLLSAPELPATTMKNSCYMGMFSRTQLVYPPELPATKLNVSCYEEMFIGCSSLVSAPELPATTLSAGCYLAMFSGCKSLVSAPELSASTLKNACYARMFRGCTSLTAAPELPAATLGEECYYEMFKNCKNLENVPQSLPALTLKKACYQGMFMGCTSLTSAPQLPASTLVQNCYNSMFYDCSSLTLAPVLTATVLNTSCYYQMFANCSNLDMITCLATNISATDCTKEWLSGVKESGTFIKATDMADWSSGVNGIPNDWNVVSNNN